MKRLIGLLLGGCLLFGGLSTMAAQEKSDGVMQPPKVLQVIREFLKPGKSGSLHEN